MFFSPVFAGITWCVYGAQCFSNPRYFPMFSDLASVDMILLAFGASVEL